MLLVPVQYLSDGPTSAWHVPDLVPSDPSRTRLLFVLESPHIDELAAGRPVVGAAGRSALRFLQGTGWTGDSLGNFVAAQHDAGNDQLAVLNVSTVPLQGAAFARSAVRPQMASEDWAWLGTTFRKSRARSVNDMHSAEAAVAGQLLLDRLQERIDLILRAEGTDVVACGVFARRFVRQLTGLTSTPLEVDHPANNRWLAKETPRDLRRVRDLFIRYT